MVEIYFLPFHGCKRKMRVRNILVAAALIVRRLVQEL